MPLAKKKLVKSPVTKKKTAKTAKAVPAKKRAVKAPSAAKKTATKPRGTTTTTTKRQPTGVDFKAGSDMALVWSVIKKGGPTRRDVLQSCREALSATKTRKGGEKPVSTIVNHVLRRAEGSGWTVKSSWKIVPPATTDKTTKAKSTSDKLKGLKAKKPKGVRKSA